MCRWGMLMGTPGRRWGRIRRRWWRIRRRRHSCRRRVWMLVGILMTLLRGRISSLWGTKNSMSLRIRRVRVSTRIHMLISSAGIIEINTRRHLLNSWSQASWRDWPSSPENASAAVVSTYAPSWAWPIPTQCAWSKRSPGTQSESPSRSASTESNDSEHIIEFPRSETTYFFSLFYWLKFAFLKFQLSKL